MDDNEKEAVAKILNIKHELGKALIILTHHYQRKEIVALGDFRGDSFGLSQKAAADKEARYIVFCGVHFMAESAAILAQPHQIVQLPDMDAGCWMADMADDSLVEKVWDELTSIVNEYEIMPLVYMNSDAWIKAFCGRKGGAVCTSSNTPTAFRWAFHQRRKIFFFPDEHLGRNTGNRLGIPSSGMIVWDPAKPLGGNTAEQIRNAEVILWKGHCLVHTRFTTDHIRQMRKRHPDARVIVHPECTEQVVGMADAVGSTSFIVKYVQEAPAGSIIIIGTEINLVERLAIEHPDKTILPLHRSLCPNMYKIDLKKLLHTLQHIGDVNVIRLPDDIKADAGLALDRMLALST